MTLTSAEAALIAEVIYDEIIEKKETEAVGRKIFPVVKMNSGDSVKIVKEGAWPAAVEVAEGAEVPILQPDYTEETKTYKKIGYRVQITHEMVEDARWDLVRRQAHKAGEQIALKETLDIIEEAKANAGIHFRITGAWGGANADEIGDIAEMIGKIRAANYVPDILVCNPVDYGKLAGLDEFVHKEKGGDISKYEVGTILGLKVIATPQISEGHVLILDYDQAGALFLREDLRAERYVEEVRDLEGQVFFERYVPAVLAPSAICFASTY